MTPGVTALVVSLLSAAVGAIAHRVFLSPAAPKAGPVPVPDGAPTVALNTGHPVIDAVANHLVLPAFKQWVDSKLQGGTAAALEQLLSQVLLSAVQAPATTPAVAPAK